MKNKWLALAAMSGFFCVAFGAFASHGLSRVLEPKALLWIDTGLKYQMFHTLAIMAIGILQLCHEQFNSNKIVNLAAITWLFGIILFSGSLYALALGAGNLMIWITPVGGTFFLIGWLFLVYGSIKSKSV